MTTEKHKEDIPFNFFSQDTNTENTNKYYKNNSNALNDYASLTNRDVEWRGEYFDVVPDQNLYTMEDYPIFAVRMRPKGIDCIMNMYCKKYGIKVQVLKYKLNNANYTLYTNDSEQMYLTQQKELLKYFNLDDCGDNEFRGIIIAVVNTEERLVHSVPFIYGKLNGKKKIIFLDPYFESFGIINEESGCITGAKFFKLNIPDVECYCHGYTYQADHHSCGIIACDFVKNCLEKKAKLTKKILNSVVQRIKVGDERASCRINIFTLPTELSRFSQIHHRKEEEKSLDEVGDKIEKQEREHWFNKHFNTLKYRKNPEPYNPSDSIVPPEYQVPVVKEINTALIEKGHKYAEWITKVKGEVEGYNSKYWISMIRSQKAGNPLLQLMRRIRRMFRKKFEN